MKAESEAGVYGDVRFSFVYDGRSSERLLAEWPATTVVERLDTNRTRRMVIWTEPVTGFEVRCVAMEYADSPAVEWTLHFKNNGMKDTMLLADIRSLDMVLSPPVQEGGVTIHAAYGCSHGDKPFDVEPVVSRPGDTWRAGNLNGGKTNWCIPFVNLELSGCGLFCGLGWPGRWMLAVDRAADGSLRLSGGIERAELFLSPGETIRLPTVLLMRWEGDRMEAHNRFRRHILKFHSPTLGGRPAPDLLSCISWGGMKTENHLRLIEAIREHQARFDCYWVDAGWYGAAHATDEYQNLKTEDWFFHVGDWRPNAMVHPGGLKPVSDAAHAAGMKFLLWFEVERAVESSPWVSEHPDWFFSKRCTSVVAGRPCVWAVFNFGNPEARQAMTDHMSTLVAENGIDIYRQDCNVVLTESWDAEDSPGRVGMSEIRYVEGLLAFWDELKRRFPCLLFDIVQRRDLDCIARSLDLSRCDHEFMPHTDPISNQAAQYGLSQWMPLSGTGVPHQPGNDYVCLSGLSTSFFTAVFPAISDQPVRVGPAPDYPWDWLRRMLDIHRQARHFLRGDFYPLIPHIQSNAHWGAMEYNRPDLGEGMLVVYRRPDCVDATKLLCLRGLDPTAFYGVRRLDEEGAEKMAGNDLMDKGLRVEIKGVPGVAVVMYRKWS